MRPFALAASLFALSACVVEGDCKPYACEDLQSPKAAFVADVMPIFKTSCTFSSCHGGASGGLKLSDDVGGNYERLVGVASKQLPTMKRIEPGKPALSFLMQKLDGDELESLQGCADPHCGDTMPQNGDLLEDDVRDTIRRWIAQGAKND